MDGFLVKGQDVGGEDAVDGLEVAVSMVDSDDVHVLELSHRVPRFLAVWGKRKDKPCSLSGEKDRSACVRKMEHHIETTSFLILGKEKALAV